MSKEDIQALVAYRLEQANQALQASDALMPLSLYREVVNRAYYAMFYAVLALLAVNKQETSKHSGAISLFDTEFVKTGIFDKDFSRWLHEAFNLRLKSDYTPLFNISEETAREILECAKKFVAGVNTQLRPL